MQRFTEGDRVRIDIPDESDIDYERYHGSHGIIVSIDSDDAGMVTGVERDSRLYEVKLESGESMEFRRRYLRSSIQ